MKNLVRDYEDGRYNDYQETKQKFNKTKPRWK